MDVAGDNINMYIVFQVKACVNIFRFEKEA